MVLNDNYFVGMQPMVFNNPIQITVPTPCTEATLFERHLAEQLRSVVDELLAGKLRIEGFSLTVAPDGGKRIEMQVHY
jgi:hypothetical protein